MCNLRNPIMYFESIKIRHCIEVNNICVKCTHVLKRTDNKLFAITSRPWVVQVVIITGQVFFIRTLLNDFIGHFLRHQEY